jgi:hypothetical protein
MPKSAAKQPSVIKASAFIPTKIYEKAIRRADAEGFSNSGFIARCVEYVLSLPHTPFRSVPK